MVVRATRHVLPYLSGKRSPLEREPDMDTAFRLTLQDQALTHQSSATEEVSRLNWICCATRSLRRYDDQDRLTDARILHEISSDDN